MDYQARSQKKWCRVQHDAKPTPAIMRGEILRGENIQTDFSLLAAAVPPRDQTIFKISGNEKELLLGIAIIDALPAHITHAGNESDLRDTAEVSFDWRNDGLGYKQFFFNPDGSHETSEFAPYPEAHSSALDSLHLKKWSSDFEKFDSASYSGFRCRWIWLWFDTREVFRHSQQIGFNICRHQKTSGDFSSWSFLAGNGGADAQSFGTLVNFDAPEPRIKAPKRAKPVKDFLTSMTYDAPMSLMPNYYTPERLSYEMKHLKSWGMDRLHFIDYSDMPAFWANPLWAKNYPLTVKACGDYLTCAATQAHHNGLEFFTDFKPYDMGFNVTFTPQKSYSTSTEFEGLEVANDPRIAAHPEWTLQTNPAWRRETKFPITRLRFYSSEPLPEIAAKRIGLLQSADNKAYEKYHGKFQITQGTLSRPHQRWTPAGNVREGGKARNWYVELSGLNLKTPFAALQIDGEPVRLIHPAFMAVEAEDADGNLAPLTLATEGHRDFKADGYFFWKEWPGWVNYTEPNLRPRSWNANNLGLAFSEATNKPTLLEPCYQGARDIWLSQVQRHIDAGVDGVSVRTLCHHNGIDSWLKYAFAPAVVELFQSTYGRLPETTHEDYERIRRLRGECFTQFLRDARKLLNAHGKKLAVQIEPGIETPPHLDCRMQLFLDWRGWLKEGLMDELAIKWMTPHCAWVRDDLLPAARKRGVKVHIISRCLTSGLDWHALTSTPQLIADAYRNGFDGFNYYETDNLIEMNPEGVAVPKGYADVAMRAARDELSRLRKG